MSISLKKSFIEADAQWILSAIPLYPRHVKTTRTTHTPPLQSKENSSLVGQVVRIIFHALPIGQTVFQWAYLWYDQPPEVLHLDKLPHGSGSFPSTLLTLGGDEY